MANNHLYTLIGDEVRMLIKHINPLTSHKLHD